MSKENEKCDECEREAEFYIEAKAINVETKEEEILFCRVLCSDCKDNL